ncbi:MAG: 4-hydroxy-2-oxovalerate aldolase [Candidatus Omnitrophica bacterium]|nr:4-hydroxy-2-oxovalerate aldolase [Candidatus Omnitrophota bacterium]
MTEGLARSGETSFTGFEAATHLSRAAALRRRLRSRARVYGAWMSIGHPEIASLFAAAEGDFVGIDLEHTTIDLASSQMIIRACHEHQRACLPRTFPGNVEQVRRLLDAGADGVIIPQVSSREDVDRAAEALWYPPAGRRSFGVAAAHRYGLAFEDYVGAANESLVLMVQVETAKAIDQIHAIVSHPAVDAVMIGPYDLSGSLGLPGQLEHPEVVAACARAIESCERHGKACGTHLVEPTRDNVTEAFNRGYTFVVLASDIFILWKWGERMRELIGVHRQPREASQGVSEHQGGRG